MASPQKFNVVTVEHVEGGSRQRAMWTIDARKLDTKDRQMVSPEFQLEVSRSGGRSDPKPFKLSIYPTATGTARGQAGFRKTKGCGRVELKCSYNQNRSAESEEDGMPKLVCRFGVQDLEVRGPVMHDFAERNTCSLDKEFEEWNFKAAVGRNNTLVVFVEVEVPASVGN
jgi:hypothetical protein